MKVISAHLYNDFSGSPKVLNDALSSLVNNGHEVVLFTSQHNGFLSSDRFNMYIVPYVRFENKLLVLVSYLFNQFVLFIFMFCYFFWVRCRKEKIVLLNNTIMPFASLFCARIFNIRTISYIHETTLGSRILFNVLKYITFELSDKIITVSDYVKRELNIDDSVPHYVLKNSLGAIWPQNITVDFEVKTRSKSVLFVGSLKKEKNFQRFVDLAHRLSDFKFIAAINCTPEEYRSLLEFELPVNLEFYHRPENLFELYEKSMFILNLTDESKCVETFGLTLIEGMSFGCIPIGPNQGGPKDIISSSFGLVVQSNKVDFISKFISDLFSDSDRLMKMSRRSYDESDKYSYIEYSKRLVKLMDIKE